MAQGLESVAGALGRRGGKGSVSAGKGGGGDGIKLDNATGTFLLSSVGSTDTVCGAGGPLVN